MSARGAPGPAVAPRPRVAVLGGGIGGLAAAAFLHRAGFAPTVHEQAPEVGEVGAGVVVAPNVARLLRHLGVLDRLVASAVILDVGWEFRRWSDGRVLSSENLAHACEDLYGEHTYTAHRADLLDALRAAVPAGALRLGARCVDVSVRGEAGVLTFDDEGAPEFARRRAQTLWLGPGHHLVHYPISAGRTINLVAFAPAAASDVESWSATATVSQFLAAHPMFPFFAQGAAQAVEDAAVLARCLGADPAAPRRALRRYESVRIARTRRLQEASQGRAHLNHLPDGPEQRDRDAVLAASDPLRANGWIYGYDALAGA